MNSFLKLCCLALLCWLGLPNLASAAPPTPKLDFDRDVRPIIAENCFACHGFDANRRQAGLRLDTAEGAYKKLDSGRCAIVSGDLKASELLERISTPDKDPLHMPPTGSGKQLTAAQKETLRRWIAQGARYDAHWAFVAPKRPPLPAVKNAAWSRNPIDRFILARLEKEGLAPSPEADRRTLLRRVTFDLTGLPPTPAELHAFLADKRLDAYERVVDRLLASPRYGERMALAWLDLARYADTHGFHIDSQRDMWRWRDWVIDAFNKNMPYDEFTVEQLAGDLLPNATLDQKIATGFNRNHPIDFEGGAIPEEYHVAYIVDRIDTTATTFMGLTMRCAQCHDHKYDPISQKEYYQFFAFFNNVPELGLDGQTGNAVPFIKSPYPAQQAQWDANAAKIAALEQTLKARVAQTAPAQAAWEKSLVAKEQTDNNGPANGLLARYAFDEGKGAQIHDATGRLATANVQGAVNWTKGQIGPALNFDGAVYAVAGAAPDFERTDSFSYGAWINPATQDSMAVLSRMDSANGFRGWDIFLSGGKVFAHLIHHWEDNAIRVNTKDAVPQGKWTHVFVTYDGSSKAKGVQIYINGKPAALEITHDSLTDTIKTTAPFTLGRRTPDAPFHGQIDEARLYSRQLAPAEVAQIARMDTLRPLLATPADKRTAEQKDTLAHYYLENYDAPYHATTLELADWRKKQADLDKTIPTTMVMQEMDKPRATTILLRGQYDKPGEVVTAGTPAILPPLPKGMAVNRLALARWLVDPSHPLTARVAVNRYWQMLFGTGLVKTAEDFGIQGERPSHRQLLDWLATEFIRTKWDIKGMMRLLVTSATYRQSSQVTPALLERDPENRLLARGPRYRLPAEFIRDQALALSGLLVEKIGGPSVKPYQPPGLWEEIAFGGGFSAQTFVQDHGENLYRRSMYTFWKRTCPPPALQTFDAPEREFCIVRRSVTNTPLQALVLMNDPTYIEAARKFAERIMLAASTPQQRLDYAYRLALCRSPRPAESKILLSILRKQEAAFNADQVAADKLLSVGESDRNFSLNMVDLASWTTVASVIFNLDETITKE